jgi:hypothetical protein
MNTSQLPRFEFASFTSSQVYTFLPPRPHQFKAEIDDLLSFIWSRDSELLDHPRYRIHTALVILLYLYLGLHPNVALNE